MKNNINIINLMTIIGTVDALSVPKRIARKIFCRKWKNIRP